MAIRHPTFAGQYRIGHRNDMREILGAINALRVSWNSSIVSFAWKYTPRSKTN
jgi:hypothetical protein